ncbi:uncharacterized protein TNCV_4763911 [Trichonephila clavipes]|nr:uncharacterized protein TNCV_4763911 [Trichonephila clavipes]
MSNRSSFGRNQCLEKLPRKYAEKPRRNEKRSRRETKNELKQEMQKKGLDDTKKYNRIEKFKKRLSKNAESTCVILYGAGPVTASKVSVKLSTYDGKTNWEVYKTQFSIISEANGWTEEVKAFQLAASIRVEAAEILQTIPDTVRLNLNSLYNSLNVRFGQKYSKNTHGADENKTQKTGESLQEYASELERLVNVHRCPTRWVFSGSGLELVTRQATVRYLYHSATTAEEGEEYRKGEVSGVLMSLV